MVRSIKRIAIISKEGYPEGRELAVVFVRELQKANFEAEMMSPPRGSGIKNVSQKDLMKGSYDLLVTVGGDGTILRVFRMLGNTPVLALNVGAKGVLAEIEPEEISFAVGELREKRYEIDKRMRLSVKIGDQDYPPVLNEVFTTRKSLFVTPLYTIDCKRSLSISSRMDGLILSTPTGSTGHSFSYKSPILSDALRSVLVTPISPLDSIPPLVIPPEPIQVSCNEQIEVVLDGQEAVTVPSESILTLKEHSADASFLRFKSKHFGQLNKMNIGNISN
ncbi:MAG: NAD(+)/NADH kinase [Thaumarchaeota archaeon]|nr:NAD(+)/NADH kinase [Nitrososphaerota archaeon]MCZ6615921.1 NAD(+)/NADH kinase [Nitrososphaerota archaeon]